MIRLLERLELAAYRVADEVVVVSQGFRENVISRGVPPDKVHAIRTGVGLLRFDPEAAADPAVRDQLGAHSGDCLVLYAGTHGISHGLPGIADAATRLGGEAVHFAFVGEGSDKPRLQRRVKALGLDNVSLRPGVPHDEVPALLAAADICLVPLRDVPLFSTFIPAKMFEYLAAGKAVVAALAGEAAQILAEAGAVVVPPEDDWRSPTLSARSLTIRSAVSSWASRGGPMWSGASTAPRWPGSTKILDTAAAGGEAPGDRRQRLPRRVRAARGRPARARHGRAGA